MRRMYFNQLGWIPLVKDALAGYNTSLLAYGQTGSGKTYTLWGPPSAMVETPSTNSLQGIVPRIFHMLFDNIQRVYNDHIGDLLDPMQRNLKDDTKNGFYVENLTEEYVSTYEDVTQILIKGLSSRKVGSTRVNSKSSRSHGVFTCIIKSWRKENSSKCFGSLKTSRTTLVDLA
nr:kinesin-like protein KIN12A [Ipomoea batatas]GME11833.1 kinesin-like protein KIN12A [Ipomoea batatas]